jgi:hypothetical protein
MRAFRIVKKACAHGLFREGARAYGDADYPEFDGVRGADAALAALESLAHYGGAERGIAFVTFEIEIPTSSRCVEARLPRDWRARTARLDPRARFECSAAGARQR